MKLSYLTHTAFIGWTTAVEDGMLSGRVGQSLTLEAIKISLLELGILDLSVNYQAHVEYDGWQAAVADGAIAGTVGESKRLECIKIWLTGADEATYSIWYRVHIQNEGWQDWRRDGEQAGTTGLELRAEAIQILVLLATDDLNRVPSTEAFMSTKYRSHVELLGWKAYTKNGTANGTTGQSLRMEALQLLLTNIDTLDLGVRYRAYVAGVGWQAWVADGATAGTTGLSLQLEAVEIELTGADAVNYSIQYRIHSENLGWGLWMKDGETAGTTGLSLEAESICIVIVKSSVNLNEIITNEIKNKIPYIEVWASEFPNPGYCLHDIRTSEKLTAMVIEEEINKSGKFTFNLHPGHLYYDSILKLKTIIKIYEVDSNAVTRKIFEGRVLSEKKGFMNIKTVVVEGELAYLNDGWQPPAEYTDATTEQLMTNVLDYHNMLVTADKKFYMGVVSVTDTTDNALRKNDHTKTFDLLNKTLIDSLGGCFVVEHIGSLRFLDYKENYGIVNSQLIEFGNNLLDLNQFIDGGTVITALVPLGKATDSVKLTIASVNSGSAWIYDAFATNQFGWIFDIKEWSDIDDPAVLLAKAIEYLQTVCTLSLTIDVSAMDLNLVNVDIQKINVGDSVRCVSKPHGLDSFYPVSKRIRNLQDPGKDRVTLGNVVKGLTNKQLETNKRLNAVNDKTSYSQSDIEIMKAQIYALQNP